MIALTRLRGCPLMLSYDPGMQRTRMLSSNAENSLLLLLSQIGETSLTPRPCLLLQIRSESWHRVQIPALAPH
jgi:hypothetical protein